MALYATSYEHFAQDKYKSWDSLFCGQEPSLSGDMASYLLSHACLAAASYPACYLQLRILQHSSTDSVLCSLLFLGLLRYIKKIHLPVFSKRNWPRPWCGEYCHRGDYSPFGLSLCHPYLCWPGWHSSSWLSRVSSKPSLARASERGCIRTEVNCPAADTKRSSNLCQQGRAEWAVVAAEAPLRQQLHAGTVSVAPWTGSIGSSAQQTAWKTVMPCLSILATLSLSHWVIFWAWEGVRRQSDKTCLTIYCRQWRRKRIRELHNECTFPSFRNDRKWSMRSSTG